jgi:hypothetical protein
MRLYISNTTKQNVDFFYRVLENPVARRQQIPIGGQIVISGDLSTPDVEYIIGQHRPYGMVSADELDRTKEFVGLCYSVDKPVTMIKIERTMRHNDAVLIKRGEEIRKEAAIASSNGLENSLVEQDRQESLRSFETTIVEENSEKRDTSDVKAISEGIRVRRSEEPQPRPVNSGKARRRAA